MPYLGAFLLAVSEEMTNAAANAECKPGASPAPARSTATTSPAAKSNVAVWIVIAAAILVIALIGMRLHQ